MTSAQDILALNDPENLVNIVHEQGRAIAELQQRFLELGALEEITRNLGSGVEAESLLVGEILTNASAVQVDQWEALGLPSDSASEFVYSVVYDAINNCLYVGGSFTELGGEAFSRIAKYDLATRRFSSIGGQLNSFVSALAIDGDYLIVAGAFTNADGIAAADKIALYTISTGVWSSLGGQLNGNVSALALSGDYLFVGGAFTNADGIAAADYVAMLTISTGVWSSIGGALNGSVYEFALDGDYLFVGGYFTDADGIAGADRLVLYTISTGVWSSIGGQLSASVYAITVIGDYLIVGGVFTSADGITGADYVAMLTISTGVWSSIGGQLNGFVYALGIDGDNLIVGGAITSVDGITGADGLVIYNIATGEWSATAQFSSSVRSICVLAEGIIAGGSFDTIDGIETKMLARLHKRLDGVLGSYNAQIVKLQDDVISITPPATTAANDMQVGDGAGAWIKKTLAEIKTILGLGTAAYTPATDYAVAAKGVTNGDAHDHSGGDGADITPTAIGAPDISISTGALADDTVYSFTPRATTGFIMVTGSNSAAIAAVENFIGYFNTPTPYMGTMLIGPSTVVGTGALTNGAANGTDGKLNINAHTDGKLYIKNRLGGSRTYRVQIFTAT
jgi:hypothetical protein